MTPNLSKLLKSLVNASETPGPPRAKDVYATAYCSSSGTYVMRGSSMPQISSGNSCGFGISVGLGSTRQLSKPFAERAAQRCDRPLRSSTRHRSNVSPSGSNTAPAFRTLLIGYFQSFRLRIGLPGCRVNKDMSGRAFGFASSKAIDSGNPFGVVTGFNRRHSFLGAVPLRL